MLLMYSRHLASTEKAKQTKQAPRAGRAKPGSAQGWPSLCVERPGQAEGEKPPHLAQWLTLLVPRSVRSFQLRSFPQSPRCLGDSRRQHGSPQVSESQPCPALSSFSWALSFFRLRLSHPRPPTCFQSTVILVSSVAWCACSTATASSTCGWGREEVKAAAQQGPRESLATHRLSPLDATSVLAPQHCCLQAPTTGVSLVAFLRQTGRCRAARRTLARSSVRTRLPCRSLGRGAAES